MLKYTFGGIAIAALVMSGAAYGAGTFPASVNEAMPYHSAPTLDADDPAARQRGATRPVFPKAISEAPGTRRPTSVRVPADAVGAAPPVFPSAASELSGVGATGYGSSRATW